MKIKKEDNIAEVTTKYPETIEVFMNYGFHCIGCAGANFESIEQGVLFTHGEDEKYLDKLIEELNKVISKREKGISKK